MCDCVNPRDVLPMELIQVVTGPSWPCGAAQVAPWADHQRVCGACGEVPF